MNKIILAFIITMLGLHTKAQIITTIAGNGTGGFSGDGGPATSAQLNGAWSTAFDTKGNFYIADWINNRIRKVNTQGIISTVAGNGAQGFSGDGGPATEAELYYPSGVAVDTAGNLYIADTDNNRVRMVNSLGIINTIAGNGATCCDVGDGGPAVSAQLFSPITIFIDALQNMYVTEANGQRIRVINTAGIISTVAGNGGRGYGGDGGPATNAALNYPKGATIDVYGNVYIADGVNYRIRKVNTAGIISTFAGTGNAGFSGDGGLATAAEISYAYAVATDASGNVYIGDFSNNRVRKVNTNGIISTYAGNGTGGLTGIGAAAMYAGIGSPTGISLDTAGNIYISDGVVNKVTKCDIPIHLNISGADTICLGNNTTLKVSVSGASTYTWSANAGGIISDSVTLSPSGTTNYTVTSINGGCIAEDTVTVFVKKIPSLTLSINSYTICSGVSKTFTVNGADSYSWTPINTLNNPNAASPSANPTTSTIYTVTGSNSCGVSSHLTVTVNVLPPPILSFSNTSYTICEHSTQSFTVSGANTYTWMPSALLSSPNIANPTASPTATTIYSVTGTDANGCNNIAPVTVTLTVYNTPTLSFTPNSYSMCIGGSKNLIVNGANTYVWTPSAYLSNATIADPTASPTATTIYTVTGTDTNNCVGTSTDTLFVFSPPVPGFLINPDTMCAGSSAVLSVTNLPINTTYTWTAFTSAGLSSNSGNSVQVTPVYSGLTDTTFTYIVQFIVPTCSVSSQTLSLLVTPEDMPQDSFIVLPDTAPHTWDLYVFYSNNVVNARWYWGDGTSTVGLYVGHIYDSIAKYTICVTAYSACGDSAYYCQNDSIYRTTNNSMIKVNVLKGKATGITQISDLNSNILIYPNPTNSNFVIESNSPVKQTIQIYDVNGKLMLSQTINGKTIIDASNLIEGVYSISVQSTEGLTNKKLVIVR